MDTQAARRRSATRTAAITLGLVAAFVIAPPTTPAAEAKPHCDADNVSPICTRENPRRPPRPPGPAKPVVATFDWSVPERLRLSGEKSYQPVDVTPDSWPVNVNACGSGGGLDDMIGFQWTIDGAPARDQFGGGCNGRLLFPAQGTYSVGLTVTGAANSSGGLSSASTVQTVEVRDLLVVFLGDSIASGEGNPDVRETKFHTDRWESKRCHRSRLSGPTQAALMLEQRDPHTSVTFIHLACTGASIIGKGRGADGGLLRPYHGLRDDWEPVPPQIDEAVARSEGRPIDALLVSAGANDIGFADTVMGCLAGPGAVGEAFQAWRGIIQTNLLGKGDPSYDCSNPRSLVRRRAEDNIANRLPGAYNELAVQVESRLHPRRVLITEYPDVTRNKFGNVCGPLMTVAGTYSISRAEAQWAYDSVIGGVNRAIIKAAADNPTAGWEVVSLGDGFQRGGYCSDRSRLIRTISESAEFQWDKNGALHPNAAGHTVYAKRIVERFDATPAAR